MQSNGSESNLKLTAGARNSGNSDVVTYLVGSAFVLFPILLYLPGSIYLANVGEFTLRLLDFLIIFLTAFLLSTAIAAGLCSIAPAVIKSRMVSLAFALGLLFWVQGSILVWDYGVFDGRDIPWNVHWTRGLVDTPVWLAVVSCSMWKPDLTVRIFRPAAILIIAVQSLILTYYAIMDVTRPSESDARHFAIDYDHKYRYSATSNVILIVLDAFQSDVFQEIHAGEPEFTSDLEGFTYFRNAVAGSTYTELAIPALLTGEVYDNSRPRGDFLREVYLDHSIMAQLKRHGFVVDIYPWVGWGNESIYFDTAIASNLKRVDGGSRSEPTLTEKKAKEALHLLDLSIFRVVPHYLKPYVYNEQKWLMTYIASYLLPEGVKHAVIKEDQHSIGAMFDKAPIELPADRRERVFKYYHLSGVHSPLSVNSDLEFTTNVFPFSRGNYVLQAKANLRYLGRFFSRLKSAGLYDQSMILVVGDHGSGETPEMYIEPPNASREPMRLEGTTRNFRRDKARAIPLVLIKPSGAGGPLKVSSAPVSLTDVPATVMSGLGMNGQDTGPSMFDIHEYATRVRFFSGFEFNPNKTEFVDDITVYRIEGDSWQNDSWSVEEIRSAANKK